MENKTTLSRPIQEDILLYNIDYFKYIFKKTEKIACAVFYILRQEDESVPNTDISTDLKESARRLLRISLKSLRATQKTKATLMLDLKLQLIEVESELRIAHAGNVITQDTLAVFLNETDSVLRSLRKYVDTESSDPFESASSGGNKFKQIAQSPARAASGNTRVATPGSTDVMLPRRERILSVLKDKGEASIKDIVEVVSDCSEKTIQRDLISLIKDNLVIKEGERRWSKYKLI